MQQPSLHPDVTTKIDVNGANMMMRHEAFFNLPFEPSRLQWLQALCNGQHSQNQLHPPLDPRQQEFLTTLFRDHHVQLLDVLPSGSSYHGLSFSLVVLVSCGLTAFLDLKKNKWHECAQQTHTHNSKINTLCSEERFWRPC